MTRRGWRAILFGGVSFRLTLAYASTVFAVTGFAIITALALLTNRLDRQTRQDALNEAEAVSRTIMETAFRHHRTQLESRVQSMLDSLDALAADSGDDIGVAQQRATELIRRQRIDDKGYFYVLDLDGNLVAHRFRELEGTSIVEHEFVRNQLVNRHGFFSYRWRNPTDAEAQPKIAFMDFFEPWEWIVTASGYHDSMFDWVSSHTWELVLDGVASGAPTDIWLVSMDDRRIVAQVSDTAESEAWTQPPAPAEALDEAVPHGVNRMDAIHAPSPRFLAWHTLPEHNVRIVLITADPRMGSFVRILLRLSIVSVIALFFVLFALSRVVAERIARPVQRVVSRFTDIPIEAYGKLDELLRVLLRFGVQLEYSRRRRAAVETKLEISEAVFQTTSEGICVTDGEGRIVRVNPAFERITGYSRDEVVGSKSNVLKSDRHTEAFYTEMWDQLLTTGSWRKEIWNRRKSGEVYPELLAIQAIDTGHGGYVAVFHDISDIHQARSHLQYMATHDPLTQLPNRAYLTEMLQRMVLQNTRNDTALAAIFIDLDNFKDVNDSLGHTAGDDLIRAVGIELRDAVRDEDFVARFGGDEFVVLVTGIEKHSDLLYIIQRIQSSINTVFQLDGHTVRVSASLGIATFPDSGTDAEELLKNADAAMYQAKSAGRGRSQFHEEQFNVSAMHRITAESRCREALKDGSIVIYLQEIVSADSGRVAGAEALVRWHEGTVVRNPSEFLPSIEGSPVMSELSMAVVEQAARFLSQYGPHLSSRFFLSVNLSATDLGSGQTTRHIMRILKQYDVEARRLHLEVTESAAFRDIGRARREIGELRNAGVKVYLDDFGEGYATLRYLRELGVDAVKLDRHYVRDVETSTRARSLLNGFVSLAGGLGLNTIIEGIETREQLRVVQKSRPTLVQGFLFGRPVPIRQFVARLESHDSTALTYGPSHDLSGAS